MLTRRRSGRAIALPLLAAVISWGSGICFRALVCLRGVPLLGVGGCPGLRHQLHQSRLPAAGAVRSGGHNTTRVDGIPFGDAKGSFDDGLEDDAAAAAADDDELVRLKANAVAAWGVNLTLVAWIVYLYQRPQESDGSEGYWREKQPLLSLLSEQLEEESTQLRGNEKLRADLQQESEAVADIAQRIESLNSGTRPPSSLSRFLADVRQQVSQEQSLLQESDRGLKEELEETRRDLSDIVAEKPITATADSDMFGPLTTSASGLLAGIDLTLAAESISLALLLSVATERWRRWQRDRALAGAEAERKAKAASSSAVSSALKSGIAAAVRPISPERTGIEDTPPPGEVRQEKLQATTTVLRFYGRWDGEHEWTLLQSLPLKGTAGTVVSTMWSARKGWLRSMTDRVLTAIVARSARGLVRRRGWKRIVEQTMEEVGRTFALGYIVETAADKAVSRISVDDGHVLQVPSHVVLQT